MEVIEIAISTIRLEGQQLREDPEDDSLIELAQDIASKGLLQPLGVLDLSRGKYQLVWGSRRLAAVKRLKWTSVPAHVYSDKTIPIKALALVENLQRRNLSLSEEVEVVRYLCEDEGKSVEEVAAYVSKGRSWVLDRVMIPSLQADMRDALIEGAVSLKHIQAISRIEDQPTRSLALSHIITSRANAHQAKLIVSQFYANPHVAEAIAHGEKIHRGEIQVPVATKACEACHEVVPITEIMFVGVCKDGCKSEQAADRPNEKDPPSSGG